MCRHVGMLALLLLPVTGGTRQALLELLNVSTINAPDVSGKTGLVQVLRDVGYHHEDPQSLLQFPWLIAGAIAAAVVVAGGVAATAAAGGLLLTVGSVLGMGAFLGWFNSHKDRRRQMDHVPPCESTNPLDTNDHDCFTRRWQLMSDYYPWQHELKRGERLLLTQETNTEAVGTRNYQASLRNEEVTAGVMSETAKVLEPASLHLSHARDTILNALADSQNQGSDQATNDLLSLRSNIQSSASRLLGDATDAVDAQVVSSDMNANRLLQSATSFLANIMREMIQYQHLLARRSLDAAKPGNELYAKTLSKLKYYSRKLDKMDEATRSLETSIGTQRDVAQGVLEQQVRDMGYDLEAYSKDALNMSSLIWDRSEDALVSGVQGSMERFKSEIGRITTESMDKGLRRTEMMERDVANRSKVDVEEVLKTASDYIAAVSDSVFSKLQTKDHQLSNIYSGIARVGAKMSSLIHSQTSEIHQSADELASEIDTDKANVLERVYTALSRAVGNYARAIKPVVRSIGEVGATSNKRIVGSELSYTDKTSDVLHNLGIQGLLVSAGNSDLLSLLTKASSQTGDGDVTDPHVGHETIQRLSNLFGEFLNRQQQVSQIQSVNSNSLESSLKQGNRQTGFAISSTKSQALGDIRSLILDLLKGEKHSVGTSDGASDSLALLQRLASGTASNARTISKVIGSTSESQVQNLAYLAAALAQADDSLVGALSSAAKQSQSENSKHFRDIVLDNSLAGDLADLLSQRQHQLKAISNSTSIVPTARRVLQELDRLSTSLIDSRNRATDSMSSIGERVNGRFDQLSGRTNALVGNLNSTIANFPMGASVVASFLRDCLKAARGNLETRIDVTDEAVSNLASRIEHLSHVNLKLGPAADSTTYSDVSRVLDTQSGSVSDFRTRVSDAEHELWNAKGNISSMFNHIIGSIKKQVLLLPSVLAGTMSVATDPSFEISYRNVEASIQQLREKLAMTTNMEERDRLVSDLVVLTKLKNLSLQVTHQSDSLRLSLNDQHSSSLKALSLTSQAIENVASRVTAFDTNDMNGNSSLYLRSIAEASAALLNGLSQLTDESQDRLDHNASATLSDEAFDVQFHSNKGKLLMNSLKGGLDDSLSNAESIAAEMLYYTDKFEKSIVSTQGLHADARYAVGTMIQDVLESVDNASDKLDILVNQPDILTQLGSVRLSTNRLLGLLYEFGQASSDSLERQVQDAAEDKQLMETNAVRLISQSINQLQTISNSSNREFKIKVEQSWDDIGQYEDNFDDRLEDLIDRVDDVNDIRYNKSLLADNQITRLGNLEFNTTAQIALDIQSELDRFDQLADPEYEYTN